MREEDLYTEQHFGDEQQSVADAPQWEQQALPTTRLNGKRNPYPDSMTAKVLLGDCTMRSNSRFSTGIRACSSLRKSTHWRICAGSLREISIAGCT
ncbi:hypothetical protein ABZ070_25905 [Streptomyces sp. NPDC006283]|uniref:hypothetical protein n=1 Tax=Streptomyces sp. NPDC006283 TaxID=3156741 RepID=UPI0033A7F703